MATQFDCTYFENLFHTFLKPGEISEIRILGISEKGEWDGYAKGTVSGYFNDPVKFARAATEIDSLQKATGIYFTLNPVDPALLARAKNRLVVPKSTTTDEQVLCHRWLLIDTDPTRPTGISATDDEVKTATNRRDEIIAFLKENSFPEPIKGFSGNGGHALYRLPDLPNNQDISDLKRKALQSLNAKFGSNGVQVDEQVFNAARIVKLYGTLARKGDSTDDRPHRKSYLEAVPDPLIPITLERLQWLAGQAPQPKAVSNSPQSEKVSSNGTLGRLDVEGYLRHYGVEIARGKQESNRTIYGLKHCIFNPEHTVNEASVIQMSDGKLFYQCFHNSCDGRTWAEARQIISGTDSLAPFCQGYRPNKPKTNAFDRGAAWLEPLPLPDGLPSVKALDPVMVPAPLRGWLMDIADRMQIPPDFSTAAAVVALGSIIGRGCGIYPKRHDDWLVVPNLWGAVVGRPALMKTPAATEAQRHLVRLETEARERYKEAAEAFKVDAEIMKLTRAAIGEEIKRAIKKGSKGLSDDIEQARQKLAALQADEPTRRRYQTQDTTVEKIGELLNENLRGLLINRDELIGWFRSLDRDGREGDRAFYLEAWNGNQGFTYDRIGRGTLDIGATCVSIFGAIVPGTLSHYVYQANRGGNGDDGLLQRFQVIVWPDAPKNWVNVDRFPDTTEKNRAWEIFKTLSGDIPGAVKGDGADIPALRFSPGGQEVFDTWRNDLETRLRSDHGLPPALESHLTKYRSLMPSLALIFHLVDVADGKATGPVSETAALMAAAWCDYLESHAGRVYGAAITPGTEAAREIVKHIGRGEIKDGDTTRSIYRGREWSRLTTPEDVRAGLEVLQEYDWLTVERSTIGERGGRPSGKIRLNPLIKT